MIHKPTNPYPYNTVINLDDYADKSLTFSQTVYNSSKITAARLTLNVSGIPYYFSLSDGYTVTVELNGVIYNDDYYRHPLECYVWDNVAGNYLFFSVPKSSSAHYDKIVYNSNENTLTLSYSGGPYTLVFRTPDTLSRTMSAPSSYYDVFTPTSLNVKSYNVNQSQSQLLMYGSAPLNDGTSVWLGADNQSQYMATTDLTQPPIECAVYGSNNALIVPNKDYSWQCRLYEGTDNTSDNINAIPQNCLGYGFVEAVEGNILKIRPHTSVTSNYRDGTNWIENRYYDTLQNNNTMEKYYISINGAAYEIQKFWNSNVPGALSLSESQLKERVNAETDSYGDALYGYAWLPNSIANISVGTQYAIYCNYIDSDEFYFSTTSSPVLKLYDNGHSSSIQLNEETPDTDIGDASEIRVSHSDYVLRGEYKHDYGAIISRYRILLYKLNNGEELVDDTEYVQASYLTYAYNKMVSGDEYRIDIEVTDTNGYTVFRSLKINVSYQPVINGTGGNCVRLDSYLPHNSLIVDWSDTLSWALSSTDSASFAGFDVYKTIGEKNTLYQVASRNISGIVEDFLVGDRVEYVYYVYPVYATEQGEQIQPPIISDPITLSQGCMKLVGLNAADEDNNIYAVDYDNIWSFRLNISDNGATLVNSKTFNDTLSRYSKETVGPIQYFTKQVSGLLGKIDCISNTTDYLDTYDNIINWRQFVSGHQLKAFIDRRGVIYVCDTESNSSDTYNDNLNDAVSVTFTIHEIDSLDYLSVFARDLEYNPYSFTLLADGHDKLLQDKASRYLTSGRAVKT